MVWHQFSTGRSGYSFILYSYLSQACRGHVHTEWRFVQDKCSLKYLIMVRGNESFDGTPTHIRGQGINDDIISNVARHIPQPVPDTLCNFTLLSTVIRTSWRKCYGLLYLHIYTSKIKYVLSIFVNPMLFNRKCNFLSNLWFSMWLCSPHGSAATPDYGSRQSTLDYTPSTVEDYDTW